MRTPNRNYVSALLAASVLAIPAWLGAQTSTTPASAASGVGSEAAIHMDPFSVTEQTDNSFITSSVGTGGRLVLDLKDVPAAYFSINRALIDALGITELAEAGGWAPGQTFNDGSISGNNDGRYNRITVRGLTVDLTPNSTNSSGASTGVMKNFYQNQFSGNQDSYAAETFDFGQGPNGVLYGGSTSMGQFQSGGAAGLAGVSSVQTKKARFDRSSTTVVAELGYWDYRRVQIDHNRPITDKFGVRINMVDLDSHGWQQNKENQKRGVTFTARWQITPTSDFSVDLSYDKSGVNAPSVGISEAFSGWDGKTVSRGLMSSTMVPNTAVNVAGLTTAYGQILGTSTALTWGGEPNGVARFQTGNNYYFDMSTENTVMNMRGMLTTRQADATTRTPLWTNTTPAGFFVRGTRPGTNTNIISPTDSADGIIGNDFVQGFRDVSFGVVSRSFLNLAGLPYDMFDRALNNSHARMMGMGENLQWNGPAQDANNKDIQFSFSQRLSPSLNIGLGGDYNRTQTDGRLNRGLGTMTLDLNSTLPNGTTNPHFLEMFNATGGDGIHIQHSITTDKAIRGNISYAKNLGRWGDYNLNVNLNANTRSYDYGLYQMAITYAPGDPALSARSIDPRTWVKDTPIKMLIYDGYATRGLKEVRQPTPFTLINSQWNGTGAESNTNALVPTVTTSQATVAWVANAARSTSPAAANIQDFTAKNMALQLTGKWWNNKLVFLGGFRRDFNSTQIYQNVIEHFQPGIDPIWRPDSQQVPAGRWDGYTRYFRTPFSGTQAEWANLTYRPVLANGTLGQPRLAVTRPTTTSTTVGIDGGVVNGTFPIADPKYTPGGASPAIFRNDFSAPPVRTYANTYTAGLTFNISPMFSPFVNMSNQILPPNYNSNNDPVPIADIYNVQQDPVTATGSDFGFRFNLMRGKIQGKYNYYQANRENEPTGNGIITNVNSLITSAPWDASVNTDENRLGFNALSGNGDYSSSGNFGWEAELTAQLAGGLRMTINGGKASTYDDVATSNPLARKWVLEADNIQMFQDLLEDAGGSIDTSIKPFRDGVVIAAAPGTAVFTPIAGKGTGIDVTQAVNAYNNIWTSYHDIITDETGRDSSTPTANLFLDYTLQSGFAKGLRLGGGIQWQGVGSAGNYGSETILYNDPVLGLVAIDNPALTNQDTIPRWGAKRTQVNMSYTFTLANRNTLGVALRISNIGQPKWVHGLALRQPEGDLTKPNRVQTFTGNPTRVSDPVNARLTLTYSFGNTAGGGRSR